jgi:hypothetical protein
MNNMNGRMLKGVYERLPKIDLTKTWSDEDLYKYFNLTQEEIDFIEKNIPKYYD